MMNTRTTDRSFSLASIRRWCVAALTLALLAGAQSAWAKGEISFVNGKAQVLSSGGDARAAAKGARVEPGEILVTGADGEVHVKMDDNALIALRPNTRVKIEEYVAEGDEKDKAVFSIFRGFMRSVTGWIGKTAPKNYAVKTPSATIGIRGTDHEVAVIDNGDEAGTYDKVNTGETVLATPFGEISVRPGRAAFAKKTSNEKPVLLTAIPPHYKPTPNESLINQTKALLEKTTDDKLKQKQEEQKKQGGTNEQGNTKISDACTRDPSAVNAFNDFIRAYELGNTALIRSKMDSSMVGYLRFIEGIVQDVNRFKQMRLLLLNTQIQCGPDVTVIQTNWEKRFLDVRNFNPGLFTGRATILLHRDHGDWKFAAVSGDNPFSSANGNLAQVTFGPSLSIAAVTVAPVQLAVTIEVVDNDLAGKGSLPVQIVTSQGDAENVDLQETAPGKFSRTNYYFSSGAVTPGNGVLEVAAGTVLTLRYVDQNPGDNRPALLVMRTIAASGTPIGSTSTSNSTPNQFSFNAVSGLPTSTPVASNTVTITGNSAPAPVTIVGGTYSINGGPFVSGLGTVASGQSITVNVTTAPTAGTTTSATLNVGGVIGVFTVTTAGGSGGTTSTSTTSTSSTTVTSTSTTTVIAGGTTPNPFTFRSLTLPPSRTPVTSNTVTITGNTVPAPVSITGGTYSINGGAFTAGAGSIISGQNIAVQVVPSSTPGASVTASLNIGGVIGTFTVTSSDTVPDPFSFPPLTGQQPLTTATSARVTITGIDTPTTISITGGTYSINGGAFTSAAGTISNGQTVAVSLVNSRSQNTTTTATLNIGGVAGSFSSTTWNTTPNPFSFNTASVVHSTRTSTCIATSNAVSISGITAPSAPISISGSSVPAATYSVNGGAATSAPGTITNGSTVTVTATAPYNARSTAPQPVATLNVGGASATFSIICN
ncbi:MAG: FecR domain-containing protein [Burkholderiales bacterium]|nr:FecR domain-containing protein [Burkholderiales bacterium]